MGLFKGFRALAVGLLGVMSAMSPAAAETLTVFAASSLKESLEEITQGFEAETGHRVTLSFAGSSALARQIEFGAPADIFVSASADWMNYLSDRDLIDPSTRFDLLSNQLVLIGRPNAAPIDLQDRSALANRLKEERLAMALIDAVPAGIYGKAALEALGLWDSVASKVAQTDSARAALALVALGATPLGIVYLTDALAEPSVAILSYLPAETHPEIRYPVARMTSSNKDAAAQLLDYLRSPDADDVFERNGFILTED